jgi:trigger factor
MSYEVEHVDAITRRIRFQIPADRVNTELSVAYRQLSGRVRLPGYRRGKIPRKVLEMRFGKQVTAEVAGKLIQEGWAQCSPELDVLGQPGVEQDGVVPGAEFAFALVVEVKPSVELGEYKGIEVPFLDLDVPEAAIDQAVEQRLEGAARIVEITDDAHELANGDIAITELVLTDGDEEVVREAGTSLRLAEERYYPGVDALMVGMKRGEEKQAEVTIGDDTQLEELKGRTLSAAIKVLSIQSSKAPEPSDEVAAELGFEGGVAGMRAALALQIKEPMEEQARSMARSALLAKLVEAHELQAPNALINKQLEMLLMERKVMHQYQGGKPGTLDLGPEAVEQLRGRATFAVQAGLLLEAVGAVEGLEITDADLEETYQRIADERGQRVEAIKGYLLQEEGAVDTLRSRLLEEKVLDWLFEQAELVEPPPMPDLAELAELAEQAEAAPEAEDAVEAPEAEEAPATVEKTWKASMKKGELLEIAKQHELPVNTKSTKAQILEALEGLL